MGRQKTRGKKKKSGRKKNGGKPARKAQTSRSRNEAANAPKLENKNDDEESFKDSLNMNWDETSKGTSIKQQDFLTNPSERMSLDEYASGLVENRSALVAVSDTSSRSFGAINKVSERNFVSSKDEDVFTTTSGEMQSEEDDDVESKGVEFMMEETPLTATVIVAAPHSQNKNLAIIGEDEMLGKWKQPQGLFHPITELVNNFWIFEGTVPIPKTGSSFKFLHVDAKGTKYYEGCGESDNRRAELIPGSWYFFVFKDTGKTMSTGFWNFFTRSSTELKKSIATEFFQKTLDHVLDHVIPDWDSALEFVNDAFQKIRLAIGVSTSGFLMEFINKWLQTKSVSSDHLLLLAICASRMEVNSKRMKDVIEERYKDFSLYLHRFRKFKRNQQDFKEILKLFAIHGGFHFWWIFFRIDYPVEILLSSSEELSKSVLSTMVEIPEVLLDDSNTASRVINYLFRRNDIDELYAKMHPIFVRNSNYQMLVDTLLIETFSKNKTNIDVLGSILRSEFLKKMYLDSCRPLEDSEDRSQSQNSKAALFYMSIAAIFEQTRLLDVVKLAVMTPPFLLPIVNPVVDTVVTEMLKNSKWNEDDYRFFTFLNDDRFNSFPQAKQQIESKLLKVTREHVKSGSFQAIPAVKLMLLVLSERETPFLERSSVVDLKNYMDMLPRNFYQNLYSALRMRRNSDKILESHRNGEAKDLVERLTNHFDLLEEILAKVRERCIPLNELSSLQDPQVLNCLRNIGMTEGQQAELCRIMGKLTTRRLKYGLLYQRFAQLKIVRTRTVEAGSAPESENPEDIEEYVSDEDDEETVDEPKTYQILEPNEWERYLKDTDPSQSVLTLQNALDLTEPLDPKAAFWLFEFKDCALFTKKVWHPMVENTDGTPFCKQDFQVFLDECADRWNALARSVADGTTSFWQMDEIVMLQPDAKFLSQKHLIRREPIEGVEVAYRNFKNIQELRHLIGPFVATLRFFCIKERGPINELYRFVEDSWLAIGNEATLAEVTETIIVRVLKNELNMDPDRPETRNAMKFIGSLLTDESHSQLIEWLKEKTEKDMEAMGKILQGSLLEAYGKLQTLRTRIAPFLHNEFDTHKELLQAVRDSEELFAHRISGRVQPIDCIWLANMLPEIQAAVRASVVSPSEDAREKLAKLHRVEIIPIKGDAYSVEVQLNPTGYITMEELKQSFQLLDMTVADDVVDFSAEDIVGRTRTYVGLIERLTEVFCNLFASGCITFTFRERLTIELVDLESEIERMRDQLEKWNQQWKELESLPLLALFSRSYLLQLADLIGRNKVEDVVSILKFIMPSAPKKLKDFIRKLTQQAPRIGDDENAWLSTNQLFEILRLLHSVITKVFHERGLEVDLPPFLTSYGRTLNSHFIDKSVVILNVSRELLVGSSLAAYISLTRRPIEPSHVLFVTANTDKQDVERFMRVWSVSGIQDLFIVVHIERLSAAGASAIREGVDRVLPESRAKLLLLAQHDFMIQTTKSLGARLGLAADRSLEINFTADELRQCFSTLVPNAANLHFFTSKLPGCGKSQQAMKKASDYESDGPDYYRVPVRIGSVEELLASLKKIENLSSQSRKQAAFLHLDVAHSVSLEFNDILLSLLIHGALFDPQKAKLGFWMISSQTTIALEFASPFGAEQFPIIAYLGKHHVCECTNSTFTYNLAEMPLVLGQPVIVNRSNSLVAAGKFLQLIQAGEEGLREWDTLCASPETMLTDHLPEEVAFDLLVNAFQHEENRSAPTFSALNAMASFLHRHVRAMIGSVWFNNSAVFLFDSEEFARTFRLNVFAMLLKVANDTVARCWSMVKNGKMLTEMNWTNRQRAMFLLGLNEDGNVTGMNVVGRDGDALRRMFHANVLPFLELQCLRLQELRGFRNLMQSPEGAEVILNAMRSLLLLDGSDTSAVKVYQLDNHPRNIPVAQRLRELIGEDNGYVLTGDNITKMMFALYRIRCGLPLIAFGEAGVGKSALFRFLIQTLLGHTFEVCNVNSGTTIEDVEKMIESAVKTISISPDIQVFLFFDEMNTADAPVIAFFKELMLDRNCHGTVLPDNLHLMAAANPYRYMQEADKEAAVGLAFRFAQSARSASSTVDGRNLVYRVNELPVAFYDHIYDFGHLCDEAEETYIEEICRRGLPKTSFSENWVSDYASVIEKSHRVARAMSADPDSAVSLRDATRAVQLFHWFCLTPSGRKIAPERKKAADLAIYLVYAFRFRDRKTFLTNVWGKDQSASQNMTEVSRIIAKMLYEQAHGASIGSGAIALNDALCENLFALYVCVLNGIFLIIVGRPGSSKSLSVEILKLVLSPGNHALRSQLGHLPALTELYFQCSPMSTSSGFKALFESAQRLSVDPKTMLAMVVLDELGLADMSPEKPIKVLHSELERKSVLTSGEEKQTPYSVVALSNWVVDAAQVNRGILILRTQANKEDLLDSAKQLADSLVAQNVKESERMRIIQMLTNSLEIIVCMYQELDTSSEIGGGHFFSMRDFFFCVKNFVCSVFNSIGHKGNLRDVSVSNHLLVQSAIRNFGGHEKAQNLVRRSMAKKLRMNELVITVTSPLDQIVQNIQDSSKPLSVHIARHLMILNRSLIGLQLLNRHVKNQLDDGTTWNVLFGSCFPGDLQVTAVTRKLRQVEQAVRSGGVLILCHADQLFESLYMVLNQQYWAQGEMRMTQIALGPSIRAIALPDGPFRIIALQDTDVALNRELMSPAVLSRFEKHELRPSHLLNKAGLIWLSLIDSHPIWCHLPETVRRQKVLYGYHEESFASLALHLQDRRIPMQEDDCDPDNAHSIWMRAANPMAMIQLESSNHPEYLEMCQHYRRSFVLEGIDDALKSITSNRMVIMTNSLRHLEIKPAASSASCFFIIQLFDVETELELYKLLDSIEDKHLTDPSFCLFIQYDAVAGPIEQFQLSKYAVDQRFQTVECRVVFIVHVDPRPVNMHWVFAFGDGWDYIFVDEIIPNGTVDIPLHELVQSPTAQPFSAFIQKMSLGSFKSLLLEMLGPVLQTNLTSLRSSYLGQFFSGVRTAVGLPANQLLIELLKECLLAQLNEGRVTWNVVDAVNGPNFDSSSSLTEGLWGVFKHKISNPLAHLLVVSDVWRVSDQSSALLWCDFIKANYPHRLISFNSSESVIQMPVGFRSCTQPFGRLLSAFDTNYAQHPESHLNGPLHWLLDRIAKSSDDDIQQVKEAYFLDWFMLRIPPHLSMCMGQVPLEKMTTLVNNLFEGSSNFVLQWGRYEADVIAALEIVSIASYATADFKSGARANLWKKIITRQMRNWKVFTESAAYISLTALASPTVLKQSRERFIQSISSIEVSSALTNLLDHVENLSQLWLGLRITKRILLFDPKSDVQLPELQVETPQRLFEKLTDLVINSVIRPRIAAGGRKRRYVRQADLHALLKSTSTCNSIEELGQILGECPTTNSIVVLEPNVAGFCGGCNQPLLKNAVNKERSCPTQHLRAPKSKDIELLFQDHQKFLFFFERVAELFIQQRKRNPQHIREFLQYLLSADSRLQVSWRFLTVIVQTVLSTRFGRTIIDGLLSDIPCNQLTRELNSNAYNFMRALLACADHEVRQGVDQEVAVNLLEAAMTDKWTVDRIRQLALIRRQLAWNDSAAFSKSIAEWARWKRTQDEPASLTDSLLFFILRFSSSEGDQARLGTLFRQERIVEELGHHKIVGDYMQTLSPLSLGVNLLEAAERAIPFQMRLLNGEPINTGVYEHYPQLLRLQPNWAPFIARLAYHAADVFSAKGIRLLREMTINLTDTTRYLLPGIESNPYLPSFTRDAYRWYVCDCGALNCVGNCGHPTTESICLRCNAALSHGQHVPREGVRRATLQDFQPPRGICVSRTPITSPTFAVRNCSPIVTRFSLLLNSLALWNAALNPQTDLQAIRHLLLTLPPTEHQQNEDRNSLICFLSNHIIVHLDLLCQLLIASRPQLTMTDKFRIGHLLLHKLLESPEPSLLAHEDEFTRGTEARDAFENGLARLLDQEGNLVTELDAIKEQADDASRNFHQSMSLNETTHWAYARLIFADRRSVQLELARNNRLRQSLPFLNFLLDDDNWMPKLNALQYLGEAMRFIALVRTVLQGEITQELANRMSIEQGLEKISEAVTQKAVILDRGRPVATRDHVQNLFASFKELWDRFSQLQNAEKRTFLDYFECQQVDVNVRPKALLDHTAPLVLILAGNGLPETTFSCQLLSHAVEAASSVALTSFIQPHCRAGLGRVRLCCSSAASLSDLDESLYAHVSTEEVDCFIRDHAIDRGTLQLAESFAMAAILGSAGSTIAEDLSLDVIPEFIFKDDTESINYLVALERRSLAWQPSPIPPQLTDLILLDLEKNRSLAEARSVLISAITHVQISTEPLILSKVRNHSITDVLEELMRTEVLTERHVSSATLNVFNRHLRLEVRHSFFLLKAIMSRMKGDDIFGGRVPEGWRTMLPERLAQLTRQKLRGYAQPGGFMETLLQIVNVVATSQSVPACLMPDQSLLHAIQQIEGPEWDGIPVDLKMENLGHVLLIAESVTK